MLITINLRPGQKRKPAGAGKQVTAKLKELAARVKEPLLAGVVAAWVVVAAALAFFWGSTHRELGQVAGQLEQVQGEAKRFDNLMKQKRKAEQIRDSLQSQITVIRGVDRDRYIWPHVLDEVAKTLPPYTWLTDLTPQSTVAATDSAPTGVTFQLTGRTLDYQAFTQFLRQLEASPWIQNVQTKSSTTVVESGRPVTSFVLTADFRMADSAYIRTVPLAQSVR
ncbi:MAG TPA: PilN domain-containing protein [Gemmatimonadales bacterium]|jgi:Tfp pilus assembly protein PilN|nr:PilN domain-containing protein [Gemmatimonadales bacterium]